MEISLGEVARRLEAIEKLLRDHQSSVVGRELYDADQRTQAERDRTHHRRLLALEDQVTWTMRGLAGLAVALIVQIVIGLIQ